MSDRPPPKAGPPTLRVVGRRVWFEGETYHIRRRIKGLGGHWDAPLGMWWVGLVKLEAARVLVGSISDNAVPAAAALAGLDGDAPAWVVADKLEEDGKGRIAEAVRKGGDACRPGDAEEIVLLGKGTFRDRTYFIAGVSQQFHRYRLVTLPDADGQFRDFWADQDAVQVVKEYGDRSYRGRRPANEMTLARMARFVAAQKDAATRRGQCPECGAYGVPGEPCSGCGGEGSYI